MSAKTTRPGRIETGNTVSELNKIYAGNLCRCTGYGPILESGKDILAQAQQDAAAYQAEAQTITQQLQAIQPREAKRWQHDQQTYIQPSNITELTHAYQQHPDANLLAGAPISGSGSPNNTENWTP